MQQQWVEDTSSAHARYDDPPETIEVAGGNDDEDGGEYDAEDEAPSQQPLRETRSTGRVLRWSTKLNRILSL